MSESHETHGDPEDYIGPHEDGHQHDLPVLEEPLSEEAEEYVGPLDATAEELPAGGGDAPLDVKAAANDMKAWFRKKEEEQGLV